MTLYRLLTACVKSWRSMYLDEERVTMQVQLVAAGSDDFRPLYVGPDRWALPGLPGRAVPTDLAVAAVIAAAVLLRRPAADDPCWPDVHAGAQLLGLTAKQFAVAIGADACLIPDVPHRTLRVCRF